MSILDALEPRTTEQRVEARLVRRRAADKRWRDRHPERVKELSRTYSREHSAEKTAAARAWVEAHPERAAAHWAARDANRRAEQYGIDSRITYGDVLEVWTRQPTCLRCGTGRGLDHIVAFRDGGDNVPDNLQNHCLRCNSIKEVESRPDRQEPPR